MGAHTFATEFSRALTLSGLSIADTVTQLRKRGFTISSASLSYWRSGRSLPRKQSSLEVITAIEEICAVPQGTLSSIVAEELALSGNETAFLPLSPQKPNHEKTSTPADSRDIDEAINWDFEAHREVVNCAFTISANYRTVERDFLLLVRPSTAEISYLHIGSTWDDNDIPPTSPNLSQSKVKGATIDKTWVRKNGSGLKSAETTRLILPHNPEKQLQRIEYSPAPLKLKTPTHESNKWHFLWPLRFYTSTITFEGNMPEKIEWVMQTITKDNNENSIATRITRVLPLGNTAQISLSNVSSGTGWFRWQ